MHMEHKALKYNLEQTKHEIEQLCSTVNHFSHKLGLGRKVRPEDWTERVDKILAMLNEGDK